MQSFTDLNNFANTPVNYASQSDYSIIPGVSSGNTTVTAVEGSIFTVPAQQPMTTMTGLTRDMLIIITPTPMNSVAFVQYIGADAGISVVSDQVSRWIVSGVRTVAQYNDVFTNLRMGVSPGFSSVGSYTFTIGLDDQVNGVFATYTVTVTVTASTVFTAPALITFNEDENARVPGIAITENFLYATNYTVVVATENPVTSQLALAPGNVAANTLTFTNVSKASANQSLANVVFVPRADFASNTYINTTVTRIYNSEATGKQTLAYVSGTNPEYSAPSGYGWSENSTTSIGNTPDGNLRITDTAVNKNYSSTLTIVASNMGNLQVGNTVLGSTVTYTGNRTTVNNSLANVIFSGNAVTKLSGNVGYVQTQTTDSIEQANITIPLNYQIPAIHIFSNIAKPFGTRLEASQPATPNVDFWAYAYNQTSVISNGVRRYDYGFPSGSNIALSTLRTTSTYRYAPLSIRVTSPNGIISRSQTRAEGTAGYFAFWLYLNKTHQGNNALGYVKSENGLGAGMYLNNYGGNLYWSGGIQVFEVGGGLRTRIDLGAQQVGAWTHYALQISAGSPGQYGTQVVSAWRNGVPLTGFWLGTYPTSTAQTGSTWSGRNQFSRVQGWQWGAPFPSGVPASELPDFFVDDIQVRIDAPYTNLQSFVPQPVTWGGNVTQMVTGI
jgi:hypothetical protein